MKTPIKIGLILLTSLAVTTAVLAIKPSSQSPSKWTGDKNPAWNEVEILISNQKHEEASSKVTKILETARTTKNNEEIVRCLVKLTQLRMSLHGYETAVEFLKNEAWPNDLFAQSTLNLFYAHSLVTYSNSYSWEIRQREKINSSKKVDLKAWTTDQIYAEANNAYAQIWTVRTQLGSHSNKALIEYLELNNFPPTIRPTLRDAGSYLWAEFLMDTSGWRPEESNEVYRLDLNGLLREINEPIGHPLQKMSAILDDLERWHSKRNEPEAAFEARRQRLENLHAHFSLTDDREKIKNNLIEKLKTVRGRDWWSMGMAQWAKFVQVEETPDNLIRARDIANQGLKAFPSGPGGQTCLNIVKSIEAPSYELQSMSTDGPGRQSIKVTYKNVSKIYFRAWPIDLKKQISISKDYNLYPADKQLKALMQTTPAREWAKDLTPGKDFKNHQAFFAPPIGKPGAYVIVASVDPSFLRENNYMRAVFMTIGDMVMITRQGFGETQVTVVSGANGQRIPDVIVSLYQFDWKTGHRVYARELSDADGVALFKTEANNNYGSFFLTSEKENQIAFDPTYISKSNPHRPGTQVASFIYTDRSIYRPLQTVKFKTILYSGLIGGANYKVLPDQEVTISLMDPNHQVVEEKKLTSNSFGSASGEFVIPTGRILGGWRLASNFSGSAPVQVEEYKRPTFEAKFLESKEALRLNRLATINGESRYYFGLPVTDASVKWQVKRTPLYPYWWYYCWWWHPPQAVSQIIATGETKLDDKGNFTFTFTPEADERLGKDVQYQYSATADVVDSGGETRSASRQFTLGFVTVKANVQIENGFLKEGTKQTISIQRTTLDGVAAQGKGTYRLVRLNNPPQTLTPIEQPVQEAPKDKSGLDFSLPDDKKRARWEANLYSPEAVLRLWTENEVRAQGQLTHNEQGVAELKLPALTAGAYRIIYKTTDPFGAEFELKKEFAVASDKSNLPLPAFLMIEKNNVQVGETARIYLGSGFENQEVTLTLTRDDKIFRKEIVRGGKIIEIPITEDLRGGFGVTAHSIRDYQFMPFRQNIFVPWSNKELKVSFATFRDKLRPGSKEKWTINVKAQQGEKSPFKAAEILAYMYDRSLDSFVSHSPPSPSSVYTAHYDGYGLSPSLGVAQTIWVESQGFYSIPSPAYLTPDRLKFYWGYPIGGMGRRSRYGGMKEGRLGRANAPMSAMLAKSEMADAMSDERQELKQKKSADKEIDQTTPTERNDSGPSNSAVEIRSNFSETAFWEPHLLTKADGSASVEFTVPDSVTSWNVWVHAITPDMLSGSVKKETKSVKELMVRPYLPRFLREGDEAEIRIVVNNASDKIMDGTLTFDILDAAGEKSVLSDFGLSDKNKTLAFRAPASGSVPLVFKIKAPSTVGQVTIKAIATSGVYSDGEIRPLPVLPGRMHLAQSKFVILKNVARKEMKFADLARNDDPTMIQEQMVVTVDGQLFYSVLAALPYLTNYPYECTEQTLNRFMATGILSSFFEKYPSLRDMAKKMSERDTQYESWDSADPNRKLALEEMPWLQMAKGGAESKDNLLNVLNPRIAEAQKKAAITRLQKSQTSMGAFPWFPGGPPSPYMTLYVLHGFSKGLEFGVDVPKPMIQKAWGYMHEHYINDILKHMMAHDHGWEFVTFMNYVLSNFPDTSWTGGVFTEQDRQDMLAFSFKHWKLHSPYLKAYLALTLHRMKRTTDAKLVWDSVMDSAKYSEDEGTHWAAEDRSWFWYNDTVETQAFALRTLMEIDPTNAKTDGLVLWLFLNKKLNHWKSTRATAEALYSLAHYLQKTGQIAVKEEINIQAGDLKKTFTFNPDEYTGKKNQIVIPGVELNPETQSTIIAEKMTPGFAFVSTTWHYSTEKMPTEARGDFLSVNRTYFKRVKTQRETILEPLAEGATLNVGDEVEVKLSIRSKHPMEYIHLRDPRGAGFEPTSTVSKYKYDLGLVWYEEVRDSGTNFFFENLPQGEYTFKYRLRAAQAGTFKAGPATLQPMYAPEFNAFSAGATLSIGGLPQ